MRWTLAYVAAIVLCNAGFVHIPLLTLPGGEKWPPMSLLVGFVFVLRDLAQRDIGHRIWWAMLAGVALSYWMASPKVALASAVAFLIAESVDWAVYTFSKLTMQERILWSSIVATPIDSIVFLAMIGHLSVSGVVAMTVSKMLGAMVVVSMMRRA